MTIRSTKAATQTIVKNTLSQRLAVLIAAQQKLSSGKRIQTTSDDPAGAAQSLSLRGRLGDIDRWRAGVDAAKPLVGAATGALQQANDLLQRARELTLQGANASQSPSDRNTLAIELDSVRQSLLELSNTKYGESYVFAGESGDQPAFVEVGSGDAASVVYQGDWAQRSIEVGAGVRTRLLGAGAKFFGSSEARSTRIDGISGVALGATASEGSGTLDLEVRHDGTSASFASGIALAGGGADDSFLGTRAIVVDAAAGTVRFGNGEARALPTPSAAGAEDYVVRDEHGAEIHLDFRAWSGASESTSATATGSVRLGGGDFVPIDLTETDQALVDPASGATIHVDLRGTVRASRDVVTFEGTTTVFDVLKSLSADLRASEDFEPSEFTARMGARIRELDAVSDGVLNGIGTLGAQGEELELALNRIEDLDLDFTKRLSDVEDIDYAAVVLELTQAETSLQYAQATGSRLLQRSLLDYLR